MAMTATLGALAGGCALGEDFLSRLSGARRGAESGDASASIPASVSLSATAGVSPGEA